MKEQPKTKTRACPKCGKRLICYRRTSRPKTAILYLKCEECNIRRLVFVEERVLQDRETQGGTAEKTQ